MRRWIAVNLRLPDQMNDMNILFITHPYPNYVPDLLLHGLRKLLGPQVVDYPRKESLYKGAFMGVSPDDQLCPSWFPFDNNQIDREDIANKISSNFFKYIVCDVRACSLLQSIITEWPSGLVLIDGEDFPVKLSPGPYVICRRETDGSDFSIPLPMALPEEIYHWIASYDTVQKEYSIGFLGCVGTFSEERRTIVEAIAQFYPDSLLRTTSVPTEGSPNPAGRMGRNEYYLNLQKCRIVLNLRGAGYDTFRFWENAACNAIHVSQVMPLFIPNNFENNRHILLFKDIKELRTSIDNILEEKINRNQIIQDGRNHLIHYHLTTKRAQYFLDRLEKIF
jgi:spore maturation protein CgeB